MKHFWVKKEQSSSLIIFFGGFLCDGNLLKGFDFGDSDLLMFFDYENLGAEIPSEVFEYEKVYVAAWSFGVWVADYFKDRLPPAEARVAICGSYKPVSDSLGIPQKIFDMTLSNFGGAAREKFLRRVFGETFAGEAEASGRVCARGAAQNKAELAALGSAFKTREFSADGWDRAFAAKSDKIFPLKNLKAAWGERLEIVSGEHFPIGLFKNSLPKLFQKTAGIARGFETSFEKYQKSAVVQRRIAGRLFELLIKRLSPGEKNVLEIGAGTGFLTSLLADRLKEAHWFINDLSGRAFEYLKSSVPPGAEFLEGDAQIMELPKNLDLIVSSSCFQWFDNLDGFFERLAQSCRAGAVLAFSTFLPDNFIEIRSLCGKGLNYLGIVGIESMLRRAGFEIMCAEAQTVKLEFRDASEVLRHLKNTGVNRAFSEFWTPAKLRDFSKQYRDFFPAENGGVSLTYRPAYFIAKYLG